MLLLFLSPGNISTRFGLLFLITPVGFFIEGGAVMGFFLLREGRS